MSVGRDHVSATALRNAALIVRREARGVRARIVYVFLLDLASRLDRKGWSAR